MQMMPRKSLIEGKVLSRAFMQGYQKLYNDESVDCFVDSFLTAILDCAKAGQSEWSFNLGKHRELQRKHHSMIQSYVYVASNEDLLAGFKRRFPDCDVTIKDIWADVKTGVRELQTRLTVSWA